MNNLFNQKIPEKKAENEAGSDRHNLCERREVLNKWISNLENGVFQK